MNVSPIFFLLIPYFLTLMVLGIWATRHTSTLKEYLVAGRRLSIFLAVPTLVATWFGACSCMGVAGMVYSGGFQSVLADPFGCCIALVLAGLFFAAPLWNRKLLTISDILNQTYGEKVEAFATLLMIPYYVATLAGQMVAMGHLMHLFLGLSTETGIIL